MTRPIAGWIKRHGALTAVLLVMAAVAAVRFRLGAAPLERDEGEYAYAGQLILRGIPPYLHVVNMKFPGTYYAYALILAIFGESPAGIHAGLTLVNAATTLLVFAIGRRLEGDLFGSAAAIVFALLSVDRGVLGVFAHATHFVLLPALGALYLLILDRGGRSVGRAFASGVLLGVAILMKQHAIFYVPLAAGLLVSGRRLAGLSALASGVVLPFLAVCALFLAQGVLSEFWFWTIRYASAYVIEIPVAVAPKLFAEAFTYVIANTLWIWVVAAIGLVALFAVPWNAGTRVFVTALLAASGLALCPGFYFRPHYFVLVLPAISFLVAVAVAALSRGLERLHRPSAATALAVAALGVVTLSSAWTERDYLFSMTPREVSRSIYGLNPFPEAEAIAGYIRERTGKDDRIAVLGSEPEIFFYADRLSATRYIYTYPLVEGQPYAERMQAEMIRQVESAGPKYLVFVEVDPSWLVGRQSNIGVVEWGNRYARACFDLVGVADMIGPTETRMLWEDAVKDYRPVSENVVYTFRKKDDGPCTVTR
jgi:hypothetical protein